MKSYLDLIPIFAKVHKKQNRMTLTCIVLAVFLVTAIFGMADMAIRGQRLQEIKAAGSWHVMVSGVGEEHAAMIKARPEVTLSGWYAYMDSKQNFAVAGKKVQLSGLDMQTFKDMFPSKVIEGQYPALANEVALSENAKFSLNAEVGTVLMLDRPGIGPLQVTVTGFVEANSSLLRKDTYAMLLTSEGFRNAVPENMYSSYLVMKLSLFSNMQKVIDDIAKQFELRSDQIIQNGNLLAALGQSRNSYVLQLYASAAVLSGIIVLAGVLMIASSLNSQVMRRTEFFGMMRCLGATRRQVMRFVRREALQWCKTAIPLGLAIGVIVVWILSAILKAASPGVFAEIPGFAISWIGIVAGTAVGVLTVLLAARSPAKKASRVSPLAASKGNAHALRTVHTAACTAFLKVETALGIHHAVGGKRNFVMVVGSFSLSIVLYLCFSTTVDFMHHAIQPLKPWAPDVSFASADRSPSLGPGLMNRLEENPNVKRVYGRMFAYQIPIEGAGGNREANLISYEKYQFDWAKDSLIAGSIENMQQTENGVLVVKEDGDSRQVGDVLQLAGGNGVQQVTVAGILATSPFDRVPGVELVICTEELFRKLTGQTGYTVIDIQLSQDAPEEAVNEIRTLAGTDVTFSNRRASNSEARGSFFSFALFIYGFLAVIALITVFHIVNNIAMSVRSRIQQYGAMRAVGMSSRQLVKMVTAEASVYALAGSMVGCAIGLPLHRLLYHKMITSRWGDEWQIPFDALGIITVIVVATSFLAVRGPAKQIYNLSIVDTINAH